MGSVALLAPTSRSRINLPSWYSCTRTTGGLAPVPKLAVNVCFFPVSFFASWAAERPGIAIKNTAMASMAPQNMCLGRVAMDMGLLQRVGDAGSLFGDSTRPRPDSKAPDQRLHARALVSSENQSH